MNARAAQEILDIIMLDDYVARKKALDDWSRRWIAIMHVEGHIQDGIVNAQVWSGLRSHLVREIFGGLFKDEIHALNWGHLVGPDGQQDSLSLACQMHVILQEPRDINEGADALQRMLAMAKGGGK